MVSRCKLPASADIFLCLSIRVYLFIHICGASLRIFYLGEYLGESASAGGGGNIRAGVEGRILVIRRGGVSGRRTAVRGDASEGREWVEVGGMVEPRHATPARQFPHPYWFHARCYVNCLGEGGGGGGRGRRRGDGGRSARGSEKAEK
ncbi:hypothetical protein E2C01_049172 [Portunus trituberculatus]|uniref:Uncharacterized protein n=1 Tax=Portunus trituberculatus TaxID=210409 RepID=A0A5B7GDH8_PORTR|nr:hypothetical protein [Portunus trituberculatus]